eukprot:c34508_g1_i1 orf=234-425(+)
MPPAWAGAHYEAVQALQCLNMDRNSSFFGHVFPLLDAGHVVCLCGSDCMWFLVFGSLLTWHKT